MAIRRTVIEDDPAVSDPAVVRSTKTVVNPNIHTPIVDAREEVVDTGNASTLRQTQVINEPLVKTEHPQKIYEKKKLILRTNEIIWVILGIIELILAFRVALKAVGANPYSGFTSFIYSISAPFALPFQGILNSNSGQGGSYFEWSTIIAAVVYFVIAYVIMMIVGLVRPVTPEEVESTV